MSNDNTSVTDVKTLAAILLSGPALDMARGIHSFHAATRAGQEEIQARFQKEADAFAEAANLEHLRRWKELLTEVGQPDAVGKYALDAQYLDSLNIAVLKPHACSCGVDHDQDGNGFDALLERIVGQRQGASH